MEDCAINWEMIIGISSTVIALCALGISIWQGQQVRTHSKISYRPHLTTWEHGANENFDFAVDLMNNGIGPALFTDFSISVDGHTQSGEDIEPMKKALKVLFPGYNYQFYTAHFGPDYSMAPKETQMLVAIKFDPAKIPSKDEVDHAMKRAKVNISYKSFYGEEFNLEVTKDKSNKAL